MIFIENLMIFIFLFLFPAYPIPPSRPPEQQQIKLEWPNIHVQEASRNPSTSHQSEVHGPPGIN